LNINILCLDDMTQTLKSPFQKVFSSMLTRGAVPDLEGGRAPEFDITGFGETEIRVCITSNSFNEPTRVLREIREELLPHKYDIVMVDDQWGASGSSEGQDILFPEVLQNIRGPYPELPYVVLFTQHYDQQERSKKFCELMKAYPQDARRIMGFHKGDTSNLMLLLQRVVSEKRMAEERDRVQQEVKILRTQYDIESQFAHRALGLLPYVRQFVGIGAVLIELAEALEPYFQWKSGEYETRPEQLRGEFVPAIMLEGEPGSGKTGLCKAIASAFSSDAVLPRTLGPSEAQGKWKELLSANIKEFYERAFKKTVVVIQADDLVWPSLMGISDIGLRSDWNAYLNTLRECIEDASIINMGERPKSSFLRGMKGPYLGKILWLFARNADEVVGDMFEPLRQYLLTLNLEFPRDPLLRQQVLSVHAEKQKMTFEEDALRLAIDRTVGYCGRDLIGDEKAKKGFLWYAIRNVKFREDTRFNNGAKELDLRITTDIVEKWLASAEHKEIMRRILKENGGEHKAIDSGVPKGTQDPVKARFADEAVRMDAMKFLERYDKACGKMPGSGRIKQKELAEALGIKHPAISDVCKRYGRVMIAFLENYPADWPNLRSRTDILKWCARDQG
jgi:hypothetical protein